MLSIKSQKVRSYQILQHTIYVRQGQMTLVFFFFFHGVLSDGHKGKNPWSESFGIALRSPCPTEFGQSSARWATAGVQMVLEATERFSPL